MTSLITKTSKNESVNVTFGFLLGHPTQYDLILINHNLGKTRYRQSFDKQKDCAQANRLSKVAPLK